MSRSYQPFRIHIDPLKGKGYHLRAEFQGTPKEALIPKDLAGLTASEIRQASAWLERGFIDPDYGRDFGQRLFNLLFPDEILSLFREALQRVLPEGGLRVMLELPLPTGLEQLPWELIYDGKGGLGFLARSDRAPLVRHYTSQSMALPNRLPEGGPLRVLVVSASPSDKPPVSSDQEIRTIRSRVARSSLGPLELIKTAAAHWIKSNPLRDHHSLQGLGRRLRQRGAVEMHVLAHATRAALQARLVQSHRDEQPFHVIHFIGHGESSEEGSFLALEAEDGRTDLVTARDFAELVAEPTVCLVVLNACESAAAAMLESAAEAVLEKGVPAVIGMQVRILDQEAISFGREFYGAWASGEPVESALAYARRLFSTDGHQASSDWGIPVLYMGTLESLVPQFQLPPLRWPWPVRSLTWGIGALIFLLSTAGLLLEAPSTARRIRTEVPVIRCLYPYPMKADPSFNIVVVEFSMLDNRGVQRSSPDGLVLAQDLYGRLEAGVGELNLPVAYDLRPPDQTCPLSGRTPAERSQAAEKLAAAINADLVIYGVISQQGDKGAFTPEFLVNSKGFEQGDEITGDHELGKSLRLDLPIQAADLQFGNNKALVARNQALIHIVKGLASFAVDNYASAIQDYRQADQVDGWVSSAGKEVLYLLLGNALGSQATLIREVTSEQYFQGLDESLTNYQKALQIDPQYARAQVGLANILYLQALGDPHAQENQVDRDALMQAGAAFRQALSMSNAPASANIPLKVHFGLGQIALVRAQQVLLQSQGEELPEASLPEAQLGTLDQELAQSEREFQNVVDAYNAGNLRLKGLAGNAYARLGMISRLRHQYPQAVERVRAAASLASPYFRVRYYALLGDTYREAKDIPNALQAYEEARSLADARGDERTVNQLQAIIQKIQK